MDVPVCRICGFSLVEALEWGRDLHAGLCGACAAQKAALQFGGERCEWCSDPGPLAEWPDPEGEGSSWVCARCHRVAAARAER